MNYNIKSYKIFSQLNIYIFIYYITVTDIDGVNLLF